jgi:hypothetical protein
MVVEQAFPRAAKSADRIDGAMMAGGDILATRKCQKEGAMAGFVLGMNYANCLLYTALISGTFQHQNDAWWGNR